MGCPFLRARGRWLAVSRRLLAVPSRVVASLIVRAQGFGLIVHESRVPLFGSELGRIGCVSPALIALFGMLRVVDFRFCTQSEGLFSQGF